MQGLPNSGAWNLFLGGGGQEKDRVSSICLIKLPPAPSPVLNFSLSVLLPLGRVEGGGQGISNKAIMQGLPNSGAWNLFLGGGGARERSRVINMFD